MLAILGKTLLCLERCTSFEKFKQIHARVFISGIQQENYVAVKLVSFCSKTLGKIGYARMIFDTLVSSANVFLWSTMITSYSNHESEVVREAILIYKIMNLNGPPPNDFTLSSVLKACSVLKALSEGQQVHAHSTKLGYNSSNYVLTTLLDMYANIGLVEESRNLFEAMHERNVVTCNAMIACYAKAGDMEVAQNVFDKMMHKDSISWTVVISGYARHGSISVARKVFDQMPEKEINSWNALITGYSRSGEWKECIHLFKEMHLSNVKPNHVTMTIALSATGQLGALKIARQLHGFLHKNCIHMNAFVYNSLVDMYAKCASIQEAYQVFSEVPIKDVVSYNVMINGFANCGHSKEALKLFPEMLEAEIEPDAVTFLGLLTVCSQAGFLKLGCDYFDCMGGVYGVEPSVDHYACIVDLLSRAGYIEQAYDLVKAMSVEPHAGVWGALLNACCTYSHVEIGEVAARELFRIEPENPGNYVLLSNIYAKTKMWDGVKAVRCLMRGKRVTKMAGCSWIDVNGDVHEFFIGDASHAQWEEIYVALELLSFLEI